MAFLLPHDGTVIRVVEWDPPRSGLSSLDREMKALATIRQPSGADGDVDVMLVYDENGRVTQAGKDNKHIPGLLGNAYICAFLNGDGVPKEGVCILDAAHLVPVLLMLEVYKWTFFSKMRGQLEFWLQRLSERMCDSGVEDAGRIIGEAYLDTLDRFAHPEAEKIGQDGSTETILKSHAALKSYVIELDAVLRPRLAELADFHWADEEGGIFPVDKLGDVSTPPNASTPIAEVARKLAPAWAAWQQKYLAMTPVERAIHSGDAERLHKAFVEHQQWPQDEAMDLVLLAWKRDKTLHRVGWYMKDGGLLSAIYVGVGKHQQRDLPGHQSLDNASIILVRAAIKVDDPALMALVWQWDHTFEMAFLSDGGLFDHAGVAYLLEYQKGAPKCAARYRATKVPTSVCVVCEQPYSGYGNNAKPLKDGRCCDDCNGLVIAERVKQRDDAMVSRRQKRASSPRADAIMRRRQKEMNELTKKPDKQKSAWLVELEAALAANQAKLDERLNLKAAKKARKQDARRRKQEAKAEAGTVAASVIDELLRLTMHEVRERAEAKANRVIEQQRREQIAKERQARQERPERPLSTPGASHKPPKATVRGKAKLTNANPDKKKALGIIQSEIVERKCLTCGRMNRRVDGNNHIKCACRVEFCFLCMHRLHGTKNPDGSGHFVNLNREHPQHGDPMVAVTARLLATLPGASQWHGPASTCGALSVATSKVTMHLTQHADERMEERDIDDREVQAVILYGQMQPMPTGEVKVVHDDLTVILDAHEYRKVVTAWRSA